MGGVAAVSGVVVLPEDSSVVGDFLDASVAWTDGEVDGAVISHVGVISGVIGAIPGVVDGAGFVDEICRRRMIGGVEEVAFVAVEWQGRNQVFFALWKSPRIENGRREKDGGGQQHDYDVIPIVHITALIWNL